MELRTKEFTRNRRLFFFSFCANKTDSLMENILRRFYITNEDVKELLNVFDNLLEKLTKVGSCKVTINYHIIVDANNSEEIIANFNRIIDKNGGTRG